MDGNTAIAAFSSVLASTVRVEKGFEIYAVDEQAKGLLKTVQQVSTTLDDARALRRQKSTLFTPFEKRMFDDSFRSTEEALQSVARLAEGCRADMEVSGGRLRSSTRVLYVLRDSPGIQLSMTQLGIASQGLNAAVVQLNSRHGSSQSYLATPPGSPPESEDRSRAESDRGDDTESTVPPRYSEVNFLTESRRRNIQRREDFLVSDERVPAERPQSESAVSYESQSTQDVRALFGPTTSDTLQPTNEPHSRSTSSLLSVPLESLPRMTFPTIPELPGDLQYSGPKLPPHRSPDSSIPEVHVLPAFPDVPPGKHVPVSLSSCSSTTMELKPRRIDMRSSTPLERSLQKERRTGRARGQAWLESRCQ